ncbi:hypothetical protein [Nocardiopsis dassonvillei]|uniref:hypothetical protein n=1 Tax=Nocardiopsis dassonvillei TaxID=2014 RepID=UPI003F57443F
MKIQMTVWLLDYATVLDSVQQLFAMGIRSSVFHSGSVEGPTSPSTTVWRSWTPSPGVSWPLSSCASRTCAEGN